MSYFSDFLDDEIALIVSLPYRVGAWISHADDVGVTERDEARESHALEMILKEISGSKKTDQFARDIVDESLDRTDLWPQWLAQQDRLEADIRRAKRMIEDRLPVESLRGFQRSLFYVARVVAEAYGEHEAADGNLKGDVIGGAFLTKLIDRFSVKTDLDAPENISAAEKESLKKLLQILKG